MTGMGSTCVTLLTLLHVDLWHPIYSVIDKHGAWEGILLSLIDSFSRDCAVETVYIAHWLADGRLCEYCATLNPTSLIVSIVPIGPWIDLLCFEWRTYFPLPSPEWYTFEWLSIVSNLVRSLDATALFMQIKRSISRGFASGGPIYLLGPTMRTLTDPVCMCVCVWLWQIRKPQQKQQQQADPTGCSMLVAFSGPLCWVPIVALVFNLFHFSPYLRDWSPLEMRSPGPKSFPGQEAFSAAEPLFVCRARGSRDLARAPSRGLTGINPRAWKWCVFSVAGSGGGYSLNSRRV